MIELSLTDLVLCYALMLLAVALVRFWGGGDERDMLVGSVRMVVQLLLVGYILHLVFAIHRPLPVVAILATMTVTAIWTVAGRVKRKMPRFYRVASLALLVGCGGATCYFCLLVVGLKPWYQPRYLIPLAGMVFGNAMNGAGLAAQRLAEDMHQRREEVEAALCLGASSAQAVRPILAGALRGALLPTINNMAAMGIVFLPGMMTGQVLSGTSPLLAVKYQIAIMCVIAGAVAATSFLILWLGYRGYFTQAEQLRRD